MPLINSQSLPHQIGALYLYYAVFNKQPLERFIKMRLTMEEHKKILEFRSLLDARSQQYSQPLQVLSTLWFTGAFSFVADANEHLHMKHREQKEKYCTNDPLNEFVPINLRLDMEDLFDQEEGILARVEILEMAYNEMKESLGKNDSNLAASSVSTTVNNQMGKIMSLLDISHKYAKSTFESTSSTDVTRKKKVLEKISAIQRSKNTLEEEKEEKEEEFYTGPGNKRYKHVKGEVMKVVDDIIELDMTFMKSKQYTDSSSYAEKMTTRAETVANKELKSPTKTAKKRKRRRKNN